MSIVFRQIAVSSDGSSALHIAALCQRVEVPTRGNTIPMLLLFIS